MASESRGSLGHRGNNRTAAIRISPARLGDLHSLYTHARCSASVRYRYHGRASFFIPLNLLYYALWLYTYCFWAVSFAGSGGSVGFPGGWTRPGIVFAHVWRRFANACLRAFFLEVPWMIWMGMGIWVSRISRESAKWLTRKCREILWTEVVFEMDTKCHWLFGMIRRALP